MSNQSPQGKQSFALPFVKEGFQYNTSLYQTSLFPYSNTNVIPEITSITFSFKFNSIQFDKKRSLAFFLAAELLTTQKSVAILAPRPILAIKVRKGIRVGCRVDMKGRSIFEFLGVLSLTTSRIESLVARPLTSRLNGLVQSENERRHLAKSMQSLGRHGAKDFLRRSVFSSRRDTSEIFSFSELPLFPPFEIGLGLHADVVKFQLSFVFNTRAVEDRFFILRSAKLPIV
jgi:hypothetical protein